MKKIKHLLQGHRTKCKININAKDAANCSLAKTTNKNLHGIEPAEMGKEHEEKKINEKVNYSLFQSEHPHLIFVDIFLYFRTSNNAGSSNSIALRPQMPTPKLQPNLSKLLKQQFSRITLQNTHYLRNTKSWPS